MSTEPDYSVQRARSTFFLFLPGVTPGIFLFLVFGTTAGCRTALRGLFTSIFRRGNAVGTSFRAQKSSRTSKSKDPEQATQNPFADSSKSDGHDGHTDGLASPLPVAGLVSKYNQSFTVQQQPQEGRPSLHSHRHSWLSRRNDGYIDDESHAVELRGITSLDQVREEYYQPSPEQSDDSGPILPIMNPQGKKKSRTQIGLVVSALGGKKTPSGGE
jgi:hypothetical protein